MSAGPDAAQTGDAPPRAEPPRAARPDAGPAIRTRGLTRRFGEVDAVSGLDLEVPAGSVYGFLGPNGAGKTTTIRLLLGLLAPSAGSAEVLGHDVAREAGAVRARAGVLLEHDGLYARLTARQNLDFFARAACVPEAERPARVRALLEEIGLWDRRDDQVADFSRGMRQKLALARAFVHRPPLLFLDEPTAGLDPPAAVGLRREMLRLAREAGVTVFLTTHNLLEAERVCDRVAVIRGGRLIAEGPPEAIRGGGTRALEITGGGLDAARLDVVRRLPGVREVTVPPDSGDGARGGTRARVELADGTATAPIVRVLVEAGAEVSEARLAGSSLEESFLALLEEEEG